MPDLVFDRVSKLFPGGVYGVREVSFTAPAGKLTSLIGPSGSGKSTLLRLAAGLSSATSGRVCLGGVDLATSEHARRDVTLVFQNGSLFPHMNVLDNVAFGLRSSGVASASAQTRATACLMLVGLHGFGPRTCHSLSGGEQQRVQLARALALEPSVVLLDEPLSNLDVKLRRQLREEICALQRRLQLTLAYVTHDEAEAMSISDSVAVLNEGRLLQQGTPREVYDHPNCEFVAGFMGDAMIYHLAADPDGQVRLGGLAMPLPTGRYPPGERLVVMVRPEAWHIRAVGAGDGLSGRILRCSYLGHGIECVVDTMLGKLLVTDRHFASRYEPGAPVVLALKSKGATVISSVPAAVRPLRRSHRPQA